MRRVAAIVIPRLACEIARQKLREKDRASTGPLAVILEPVIASGGVGGITDIEPLLATGEANIEGVVIGRALYDGKFDAARALRLVNAV